MSRLLIGIAGGSGSGKTTVAREIIKAVGEGRVTYIQHDSYYKDRSNIPLEEREKINYDHPDALETSLLIEHLNRLLKGESVEIPIYDFITHTRKPVGNVVYPRDVIIVEGILIFVEKGLRELFDIKLYVDTDPDIRFIRRLKRDIEERGRTIDSVIKQYLNTVRPMHIEFVEPTKRFADVIIPQGGYNQVAINMVISTILQKL